jgi:hypothetical protein
MYVPIDKLAVGVWVGKPPLGLLLFMLSDRLETDVDMEVELESERLGDPVFEGMPATGAELGGCPASTRACSIT